MSTYKRRPECDLISFHVFSPPAVYTLKHLLFLLFSYNFQFALLNVSFMLYAASIYLSILLQI